MNKPTPRYKGLILDFGGVIARSFFETADDFGKLLGLAEGALRWRGPFDPPSDPLWRGVLTGEITEAEYWARRAAEVGTLIGERWTFRDFCRRQNDLAFADVIRPEAEQLIAHAKQEGIKLAVLTNELESLTGPDWIASIPIVRLFDAFVDATHTQIAKPDPRAYRLALEALRLQAEEAIFIDDQIKNIRGAEAVGIRSIHLDICDPNTAFDVAYALLGLKSLTRN
ncbi:MAG TPA: HAD-IA family hydrolase [Xanthobacteraceae bacterium]|nr:HAD-IA family hydrolase [Xanthobacteraceae bacterium]